MMEEVSALTSVSVTLSRTRTVTSVGLQIWPLFVLWSLLFIVAWVERQDSCTVFMSYDHAGPDATYWRNASIRVGYHTSHSLSVAICCQTPEVTCVIHKTVILRSSHRPATCPLLFQHSRRVIFFSIPTFLLSHSLTANYLRALSQALRSTLPSNGAPDRTKCAVKFTNPKDNRKQ